MSDTLLQWFTFVDPDEYTEVEGDNLRLAAGGDTIVDMNGITLAVYTSAADGASIYFENDANVTRDFYGTPESIPTLYALIAEELRAPDYDEFEPAGAVTPRTVPPTSDPNDHATYYLWSAIDVNRTTPYINLGDPDEQYTPYENIFNIVVENLN